MKNLRQTLSIVALFISISLNAQEVKASKPETIFFKGFQKVIKTNGDGDTVAYIFRDEQYQQIDEYEAILFENTETMIHFFKKIDEVQNAPKTKKSVDLTVSMKDFTLNKKEVKIVRYGFKQFVTYIYLGKNSYSIIPKTLLKRIMKKINQS